MTWRILKSRVMNGANHLTQVGNVTSLCGQLGLEPLGTQDGVIISRTYCSQCVKLAVQMEERHESDL